MMNAIVIDIEKAFDNCDVPDAEAVSIIANFLNTIVDTGENLASNVKVEGIVEGSSTEVEDIQDRIMMEQCILESVMKISQSIKVRANNRMAQLQEMYDATKKLADF